MQLLFKIRSEIILLHAWCALFFFSVMENPCFRQVEIRAYSINVRRVHYALSVFLRDGKFCVEAGGLFSLCIFSLKLLEIVLLHVHGVHCVFSFVMENSCLMQVEFYVCAIIVDD